MPSSVAAISMIDLWNKAFQTLPPAAMPPQIMNMPSERCISKAPYLRETRSSTKSPIRAASRKLIDSKATAFEDLRHEIPFPRPLKHHVLRQPHLLLLQSQSSGGDRNNLPVQHSDIVSYCTACTLPSLVHSPLGNWRRA